MDEGINTGLFQIKADFLSGLQQSREFKRGLNSCQTLRREELHAFKPDMISSGNGIYE